MALGQDFPPNPSLVQAETDSNGRNVSRSHQTLVHAPDVYDYFLSVMAKKLRPSSSTVFELLLVELG